MKPYLREKIVHYFKGKRDAHPGKGWINWWEDINPFISRRTMKQKLKKDYESERTS